MRLGLVIALLLSVGLSQQLEPADFAQGVTVTPASSDAVQRVAVPSSLYGTATRVDLGDVRVFNAADEVVPHALLAPAQEEVSETLSLPLYPLPVDIEAIPTGLSLQIRQGDVATSVDVVTPSVDVTTSYIVDTRALNGAGAELTFDWQAAAPFVTEVSYQTSRDLVDWSEPRLLGALAELEQGELSLRKASLKLPSSADYLWIKGATLPVLESATAALSRSAEVQSIAQTAELISEEDNVYVFDAGGYYRVETLELGSQPNVLARITLESSNTLEDWSHKYTGVFFNLTQDGQLLRSPAITVPQRRARYWRLTVDPAGGGFGEATPGLTLGVVPETLAFVARGEGPYTLAYGSLVAEAESFDSQLLSTELVEPSSLAEVSPPFELSGSAALSEASSVPWQQLLLWTVLIGGVALLAVLATSLLKETRPNTAGND